LHTARLDALLALPRWWSRQLPDSGCLNRCCSVPTLVRELEASFPELHVTGFATGDGVIGSDVQRPRPPYYRVEWMHGHGQVSERTYRAIHRHCSEAMLRSGVGISDPCQTSLDFMEASLGGYFGYHLYDDCVYSEPYRRRRALQGDDGGLSPLPSRPGLNGYACAGRVLAEYMDLPEVRVAMHIQQANFFSNVDNADGLSYLRCPSGATRCPGKEANTLPFYEHVRASTDTRVLIYNGDADPGINSMITQDAFLNYFDSLGVRELRPWRPWTIDGLQMMGGYVVELPGDFSYLTIRGGGHMVPEYKPASALAFISAFVHNTEYPEYTRPMAGLTAGRSNSLSQGSTWTERVVPEGEELEWLCVLPSRFSALLDQAAYCVMLHRAAKPASTLASIADWHAFSLTCTRDALLSQIR
jgi:hypothetical protein